MSETNYFRDGQRVKLVNAEPKGKTGTVVRVLMSGHGQEAWVKMDADLPKNLRSFHEPTDPRFRNRKVYFDEVEIL